jgi:hypothetical protein
MRQGENSRHFSTPRCNCVCPSVCSPVCGGRHSEATRVLLDGQAGDQPSGRRVTAIALSHPENPASKGKQKKGEEAGERVSE